ELFKRFSGPDHGGPPAQFQTAHPIGAICYRLIVDNAVNILAWFIERPRLSQICSVDPGIRETGNVVGELSAVNHKSQFMRSSEEVSCEKRAQVPRRAGDEDFHL